MLEQSVVIDQKDVADERIHILYVLDILILTALFAETSSAAPRHPKSVLVCTGPHWPAKSADYPKQRQKGQG
jgi:hypothetical protein